MTFDLERFVSAQADMYETALQELKKGRKRSHWIWYIFPQLRGMGRSTTAHFYGIENLEEARAYLAHPILGQRLKACCEAMLLHQDKTAIGILGETDAMKLRSSMTLFALVSEENSLFHQVLAQFYEGRFDGWTLELIQQ